MQRFPAADLKYEYSRHHRPVGTVAPGERFAVDTEDGFSGRFRDPSGFTPEAHAWVADNLDCVTGPIAVTGARAGEAVTVSIHAVDVETPGSVVLSRCEAPSPDDWWHEEYRAVALPISAAGVEIKPGWTVPVRPVIGCLAVAPAREVVLSRRAGAYGGNMDCGEITTGATVVLPVQVDGAMLYFGDCKAAMADGEVAQAPEVRTRIEASATPCPRPPGMAALRIISGSALTTVVSDIALADACRLAFKELLHWVRQDFGLQAEEAATVMAMAGHCGVCQVSNDLHTGRCTIARSALPGGAPERS
jgi:acetamidase/formamidase